MEMILIGLLSGSSPSVPYELGRDISLASCSSEGNLTLPREVTSSCWIRQRYA